MLKKSVVLILLLFVIGCNNSPQENQLSKEIIKSPDAPKAIGPYSQAVKVGNTLYCSGQIAINPKTGEMVSESIEAKKRNIIR